MHDESFIKFFKNFNKDSLGQTLSKTPKLFFERHNYEKMKYLIGNNYQETRKNIFRHVYGPGFCIQCGKEVDKLIAGWKRGWHKTCSYECQQKIASTRQLGTKNYALKMTPEQKLIARKKQSATMKQKIMNGDYTPSINNYKNQRPIKIYENGEIKQVRSLWELIFKINNPDYLYETVRIEYFDKKLNTNRIYITDFYDFKTNTIFEIRPKVYQHLLDDKRQAVINKGYNFKIIDEDYFNTQKTEEMINKINSIAVNLDDIKGRLKWLKKA